MDQQEHNNVFAPEREILEHQDLPRVIYRMLRGLNHVRRLGEDDASGEGTIALIEAAKTYDPTRGTKFRTHAWNCIVRRILDEARKFLPIPLPRGVQGCGAEFFTDEDTMAQVPAKETTVPDDLWDMVDNLPEDIRDVMKSRFWDEKEVKDIARERGRSRQTIHNDINRGLRRLRRRMGVVV